MKFDLTEIKKVDIIILKKFEENQLITIILLLALENFPKLVQ